MKLVLIETSRPSWDPHLIWGVGGSWGAEEGTGPAGHPPPAARPPAEAAGLRLNLESAVNDGVTESRRCYL